MSLSIGKQHYTLKLVSKARAQSILESFHYLSKVSKGFKSGYNYGLFHSDRLVGVCVFSGLPVPEIVTGLFGLDRDNQDGMFELSRLCIDPDVQQSEHNIASWFVSRAIKNLRIQTDVRCILSYADSDYHAGTLYRACNFTYYGLTEAKKDFWLNKDGVWVKHTRGKVKNVVGEWRDRARKHRFLMVFDRKLTVKWTPEQYKKLADWTPKPVMVCESYIKTQEEKSRQGSFLL